MKKLMLLALLLAGISNAAEFYNQTVSATTGATTCTTALQPGGQYAVYADVAAKYVACRDTSCSVATTSAPIPAGVLFDIPLPGDHKYLCFKGASATATIYVYKVVPRQLKE